MYKVYSQLFFGLANFFGSILYTQFFILDSGHQITLEGVENKEDIRVVITVLYETEVVNKITTRVIEEHESADGEVTEISRNYFVRYDANNIVFYMGEDVDDYEDREIVGHVQLE